MSSSNPTTIITGASSGIGRATAILLASHGHNLTLVGRSLEKLRETASQIQSISPQSPAPLLVPVDITHPDASTQIVSQTLDQFGYIDVLINAAGFAPQASITDTSATDLQSTFATNLTAPFLLTQSVLPSFIAQKSGFIVNISSLASIDPFPGFAAYASSKAALNMLTLVTAREGEPHNIQAVAIAPGAVETPMLRSLFDESVIPTSATLPPEKIAQLILDCITGRQTFTPGQTIEISA